MGTRRFAGQRVVETRARRYVFLLRRGAHETGIPTPSARRSRSGLVARRPGELRVQLEEPGGEDGSESEPARKCAAPSARSRGRRTWLGARRVAHRFVGDRGTKATSPGVGARADEVDACGRVGQQGGGGGDRIVCHRADEVAPSAFVSIRGDPRWARTDARGMSQPLHCLTPEEAALTHGSFTAALASQRERSVVDV